VEIAALPARIDGSRVGPTPDEPGVLDALALRAAAGDRRAFEEVYRQMVGQVYALCLRMTADAAHADVLTQDVFVRAWRKLRGYRGEGAFGGWLRRLTINLILDDRRGRAREQLRQVPLDDPDRPGTGAHHAASGRLPVEEALDLERAVGELPPGARMAFVLHDVYGYRHREIAKMAGLAEGTVKSQLHTARRMLRRSLRGWREESAT
jgi:RNA polymerase sigma factor (sigma-70 family)